MSTRLSPTMLRSRYDISYVYHRIICTADSVHSPKEAKQLTVQPAGLPALLSTRHVASLGDRSTRAYNKKQYDRYYQFVK
ncbi:hypothetical protein WA026_001968, partial [Henosepilachna vigintioctopunctata]